MADWGPNPGSERSQSSTTLPSAQLGVDRVAGARRAADAAMDGQAGGARRLGDPRLERGIEVGAHDVAVAPLTRPRTSG